MAESAPLPHRCSSAAPTSDHADQAPELRAHTTDVLTDLGLQPTEITALATARPRHRHRPIHAYGRTRKPFAANRIGTDEIDARLLPDPRKEC